MPEVKPTKSTWLTPYYDIWKEVMGGNMAAEQAAKFLRPIEKEIGTAELLDRFTDYLRSTPPRYVSIARFAERHGQYGAGAYVPKAMPVILAATQKRVI